MIKILKLVITLIALTSASYFAFFVPLGSKTLYEHLKGISKTEEAQKFQDELGNKIKDTARVLSNEIQLKSSRFSATDKDLPKKGARKSADFDSSSPQPKSTEKEEIIDREAVLNIIRKESLPSAEDRDSLQKLVRKKIDNL